MMGLFQAVSLLLVGFVLQGSSSSETPGGLRTGAEEFVKLIEANDLSALTNRFSEQGTSFVGGTYALTKTSFSPDEIRKDFEAKTGVYCLFFDTSCFRNKDAKERARRGGHPLTVPLQSLADLIAKAKIKKFVTYPDRTNGQVSLILSNRTPDTARLGEDAVNFYFRFEQGQWKLRNLEYN